MIIFRENHVSERKKKKHKKTQNQQVSDLLFYTLPVLQTKIRNPCVHIFILQSGNSIQIGILYEMRESIDENTGLADGVLFFKPIITRRFQPTYEQINGHPAANDLDALTTKQIYNCTTS